MRKMKELSMILDDAIDVGTEIVNAAKALSVAGDKLISIASAIRDIFSEGEEPAPPKKAAVQPKKEAVPKKDTESDPPKDETTEKTYSKEEVRKFLAGVSNSGHRDDVKALLVKYGAGNLTQLDPAHYADIMADAEAIKNG